jgi:hypothetical protein
VCLAAIAATGCSSGGPPAPAAVVGGEAIGRHDVDRLSQDLKASQRQAAASPIGPDGGRKPLPEQRLHQIVLSLLVKAKLVAQLAAREGVTARAGEMARTASDQLAPTEFSDSGWGRGDFETAVRSSILSKALAEKLFPTIDVAEDAIRDYFQAHPDLFRATWNATVDLAFFATEGAAKQVTATSGGPSRFADAARRAGATDVLTSQAVDQASPLPAEILTAVGAMTSHTVSAPVPVPKGYWVINTDDISSVAPQSFERARASIRDHLADQERQQRFAAWLTGQLRTADVHVNASYGRWPQDFWL